MVGNLLQVVPGWNRQDWKEIKGGIQKEGAEKGSE